VDIRFTYDLNGVLEVEATVVETRRRFSHVVTRYAGGLTPQQLEQAVRDLARLKTHPRDESVNRFLLRRAERVYQELSVDARAVLGQLLDGFEAALESQEPAAIEHHRSALKAFLDSCDGGLDASSMRGGHDE
jgi:molecular chaperone HscC